VQVHLQPKGTLRLVCLYHPGALRKCLASGVRAAGELDRPTPRDLRAADVALGNFVPTDVIQIERAAPASWKMRAMTDNASGPTSCRRLCMTHPPDAKLIMIQGVERMLAARDEISRKRAATTQRYTSRPSSGLSTPPEHEASPARPGRL
jgi:hypothetical protein